MEMVLELSKNESKSLVELLYLGNWMANSTKSNGKKTQKYEALFNNISMKILSGMPNEQELYNRLIDIIEFYNSNNLFPEFAKQYANYVYPLNQHEDTTINDEYVMRYCANSVLKEACENELQTSGFQNVKVILPNLTDKIKERFNSIK